MKKFVKLFLLLFLFFCFLCVSIFSYADTVSQDLANNFFRLHIIANSNSDSDQELKLKIRDNIIAYIKNLDYKNLSKEQIISLTKNNLTVIEKIVNDTILENGFDYSYSLNIGNYYFPTKYYGNISLPAGNYDALKIEIGNAEGKNWWCSLFPPLCFTDISSGIIDESSSEILKNNLTDDEYLLISDNNETIKLKFKLIELLSTTNK